jgi:hypothetical protein
MAEKRLSGPKNYLYLGERGTEVSTGTLSGEWFKITGKAASGSAFPATAEVGDIIHNVPAITLVTGDKAKPITLTKLAFVTNVPQSAQKEKFEDTTQVDVAKSFEEGDKPEITGTIEGYWVAEAPKIDQILKRFFRVVTDDGAGAVVFAPVTTGVMDFFLGRNETSVEGEVAIMEYMPSIIESLSVDKPMQGKQTFNFGYTVVGSEHPSVYNYEIAA